LRVTYKSIFMKFYRRFCLSVVLSAAVFVGGGAFACDPYGDQYCPPQSVAREDEPSQVREPKPELRGSREIPKVANPDKSAPAEVVVPQGGVYEILNSGAVQGERFHNLSVLRSFYDQRNFELYWVSRGRPNDDAKAFLDMLGDSWTHGLNPYSYRYALISQLFDKRRDESAMQAMDVLLTDAFIEYGQDLTGIRVDPSALMSSKRFWQKPLAAEYLIGLLGRGEVASLVDSFIPKGITYRRLRQELIELVESKPAPYEAVLPIKMRGVLRPYEQHEAVRDLRVRFDDPSDSLVYDDILASRVMAFQAENGLETDGVIGPATLQVINRSRLQKIHQVIANLERLRWVPEEKPDKFVIVNVPSAMLWAVEGGEVAFDMPVIVGRKKRATNIFVTEITGVRLNPTWTVPPTIKKEDILPKLIRNRNYLKNKGMELVYGSGKNALTLDATAIDWTTVTESELKSLRMVQTPGAHNPLGQVRILMPNGYNIYLHDTNEKHYFNSTTRAVSSGCVRMKQPFQMADFILKEKPNWSEEKTQAILKRGKIRDIFIPQTIPVYLVYYTAWVDDGGDVVLGNDLYDYDAAVIKMLSNLDEIFIPMDNN